MKVDLAKIFLTPPRRLFERVVLFIMLAICFSIFFRPLQFTSVPPVEAVLTAFMPAVSISWGWIVLMRFVFQKTDYVTIK